MKLRVILNKALLKVNNEESTCELQPVMENLVHQVYGKV